MKILGIASESHDSGLALVDDGLPILVIEEERLNRQKHTALFPAFSLKAVFESVVKKLEDIDVITAPWDMQRLRWTFLKAVFGHPPDSFHLLRPRADTTNNASLVWH